MKTKLINALYSLSLLLFITAFGFQHNPPSGWYQQFMPADIGGRQISDIFFLDSLTGWAVTPFSTQNDTVYVLKTSNGGDNWFINYTGTGQFVGMARIYFLNEQTGYACGNGFDNSSQNNFAKTTNSGANWFNISPPDPFEVYHDLSVLNEDTIWLVSRNSPTGGVFRTIDGGQNWVRQLNAGGQNPSRIYMHDANFGFITNNTGTYLRRTTDSGQNWEVINGQNGFTDIKFADANTGWKAFDSVRVTIDGGTNWLTQQMPHGGHIYPFSQLIKLSLIDKDTLWGVGGRMGYPNNQFRAIIYKTTNGGQNWGYQLPDTSYGIALRFSFVNFINHLNGWAYNVITTGVHTVTGGGTTITNIQQISSEFPLTFVLHQNYPNPFNPDTNIKYELRSGSEVKLVVYDVSGKLIKVLVSQRQSAGTYQYTFDGSGLSSGVYFYSLSIDRLVVDTKKMLLVK